MKLTGKEEKFVQGLFAGLSQRRAYKEAYTSATKWKDETIDNKACLLAKKDEITERLKELREQVASKNIKNEIEIQEFFSRNIDDENIDMKDRIRSAELLGKAKKMFTEKVELDATHKIVVGGEIEEWAK